MKQTTSNLVTDLTECPHCGAHFQEHGTVCPYCQQPLAMFAKPSFGPHVRIILRITPSNDCVPLNLTDTIIMGRKSSDTSELNVFDLTPFKGNRRGVSRRHCIFRRTPDRLSIRDLDSTNGTFLNRERLEPGKHYEIQHGDDIILGELLLTVYFNAG